ncbi:MAG: hypothetical protein K8F91_07125 [Candidatus Obscuribacterales bacterium]|nr:hypothetical protein [Candidatus Obscuribacterales bacterium]
MSETEQKGSKAELFATLKELLKATDIVDQTLACLLEKRVTLEEKMIRRYLVRLAIKLSNLILELHAELADPDCDIETRHLRDLRQAAAKTQEVIGELLKMIAYNWNFLEQYFEHEFYAKLINEHKLEEELTRKGAFLSDRRGLARQQVEGKQA